MPREEVKVIPDSEIDTVLSEDFVFNGIIKFQNSFKIKGKFDGTIKTDYGYLVIGPEAVLDGSITTGKLTNFGKIKGDIEAKERIEIFSGALINGDISTNKLIIEEGGILNGNCKMNIQLANSSNTSPTR